MTPTTRDASDHLPYWHLVFGLPMAGYCVAVALIPHGDSWLWAAPALVMWWPTMRLAMGGPTPGLMALWARVSRRRGRTLRRSTGS